MSELFQIGDGSPLGAPTIAEISEYDEGYSLKYFEPADPPNIGYNYYNKKQGLNIINNIGKKDIDLENYCWFGVDCKELKTFLDFPEMMKAILTDSDVQSFMKKVCSYKGENYKVYFVDYIDWWLNENNILAMNEEDFLTLQENDIVTMCKYWNFYRNQINNQVVSDFVYKIDASKKLEVITGYDDIETFFNAKMMKNITLDTIVICSVDTKEPLIKIEKYKENTNTIAYKFCVDITSENGDNFRIRATIQSKEQLNKLIKQTVDALENYPQFSKYADDLSECIEE